MGNEETNSNVPTMKKKSSRVDVEVGNSSTENDDDINDTEMADYKQVVYKLFQYRTFKLKGSNGDFGCPFCDNYKEEHECHYTHLLLHAIRVAESEENRKHKASHLAMARFLAIDLADEVKAEADRLSRGEDGKRLKTPRLYEDSTKGEEELDERTDELVDLISRDYQINGEMQGLRRKLIKGILKGSHAEIGIKYIGEIDSKIFIREMKKRFPRIDAEIKGVELCSLWQESLKNPQWYPYQIILDDNGKPKRVLKEDDSSLQDLNKKWGREIHDAVVRALNDLHDYNPSGCYVVPELWNFKENRKAKLDEVISYILEAVKDVSKVGTTTEINNSRIKEHIEIRRCLGKQHDEINVSRINNSDEESEISDSEIYKERNYELLKSCIYKVMGPHGELRCPFCSVEEVQEYNGLLRHALGVAKGSSESAKQRGMHSALAKYLFVDLQDNAKPPPQTQSTSSPASSSGEDKEIAEEVQLEVEQVATVNGEKLPVEEEREVVKRTLKSNKNMEEFSVQMISKYFHMPVAQASRELNIGLTRFKKRCRELGIERWPYKKLKVLNPEMGTTSEIKNSRIKELREIQRCSGKQRETNAKPPPQSTTLSPASSNGDDEGIAEDDQLEAQQQLNDADGKSPVENDKKVVKRTLKSNRTSKKLSRQTISQYFHMPIAQAARELNMGIQPLQKRCREVRISRWPWKKLKRLQTQNNNAQGKKECEGKLPESRNKRRKLILEDSE